ncbi:HdeD family acid-resistance protein [Paracoccus aerodenitrificans]|uniref:HdeD family acid-resistance protein n=1 Tax=Paracoccus aerodenitrificans TaxID=3017781 RepID=UPI0022F037AC|nr:DUF308 domain-containing protein [Paracoccus aerodenitrificans]WBU63030.1 DUF308 domain-containing protein [Paracoccus aerodenitrificans]
MTSWLPMMAAGLAALIGGVLALINPVAAAVTTVRLVSWVMLIVALLQGWAAYRSDGKGAQIRAAAIAAAAFFLSMVIMFGNPAESGIIRILVGLCLVGSGAAKLYAARVMKGTDKFPLMAGTGVVSLILGLVVWFGLSLNFGSLLGLELLASGLGLVLLAMYRRKTAGHTQP